MKVTVHDIIEAHAALAKFGGLSLKPGLALRFARITRAIRQEVENAREVQNSIIEKHIARDSDNKPIMVKLPDGRDDMKISDVKAYRQAIKELDTQEVEIPGEPLKLSELGDEKLHSDLLAGLHFAIVDG